MSLAAVVIRVLFQQPVLSEVNDIITLKEERTALKPLLDGNFFFVLPSTGYKNLSAGSKILSNFALFGPI